MKCPKCGFENGPESRFCMKCGTPLTAGAPAQGPASPKNNFPGTPPAGSVPPQSPNVPAAGMPRYPGGDSPYATMPAPGPAPYGGPAIPPQPGYPPPAGAGMQPAAGQPMGTVRVSPYAPMVPPGQGYAQGQPYSMQQPGTTALNIWGPFAGYGTRRRHIGWLMDNRGDRAQDLITKANSKFTERSIPGAQFRYQILTARGLIVESRPYFILSRGLVNVGLNISQFGRDLFISMASYLKPPISNLRVLILAVMVLFAAICALALPSAINNEISNFTASLGGFLNRGEANTNGLLFLLCVIGPLSTIDDLLLLGFAIFSIWKYFTEKDILAGLRTQPNEFNEDDLMALEKAVEQTVRMSIDEIGLNQNDLKPVSSNMKERLI